jgi:hypothetical protein
MASIGAFVVGAGMTGGFAYGIYDLRKKKQTSTTKYKGFIGGLVIGIVILVMAMFMGGRAAKAAVQMNGGLGGPTEQQMDSMTVTQLESLQSSIQQKKTAIESLIERISKAIDAKVASNAAAEEAQKIAAASGIALNAQ